MMSLRINPRRKPLLYIIVALLVILFFRWLKRDTLNWDTIGDEEIGKVMRDPDLRHDKWIIVTTIQNPTPAVRKLAEIPGWKLLVVGDRKTSKSWSLPGAIYLDVKSQKSLGYQVHAFLPYDSYTRKVIGYLYAIEHGAKYIYETDDDNFPDPSLAPFMTSIGHTELLVLHTQNLTYNPFVHFGQSSIWPRGYPLEHIGMKSEHEYRLCKLYVPAIQQGLVNGDPDVDALFRLTRKQASEPLKVNFDSAAPPLVLPHGTFAPLNSQNTLYTGKAFWALILPVSVSVRACDIYRSYWAQTLLWKLGDSVAFFPPNSVQKRNAHSDLMDAVYESEVYHFMGAYVKYLKKWTCDKMFFFDCVSQLTSDLVEAGFLKRRDADLVDAWITDLATVGYVPPSMKSEEACVIKDSMQVTFYPDEQETTLPQSMERHLPRDAVNHKMVENFLSETCGHSHIPFWHSMLSKAHKYSDDLLVISVYRDPSEVIPALEAAYRPHFPHILYCGTKQPSTKFFNEWKVSFISPANDHVSGVSCVHAAMRLKHYVKGYIHVTDTIYLDAEGEKMKSKHDHLMWVTGELDAYRPQTVSLCKDRAINCVPVTKDTISQLNRFTNELEADQKVKATIKSCFAKLGSDPSFQAQPQLLWVTDMTFRIPVKLQDKLLSLVDLYLKDSDKRKYDFVTLLLMECLEHTVEYMTFGDPSDPNRANENIDYLFPYQFKTLMGESGSLKPQYCQNIERFKG